MCSQTRFVGWMGELPRGVPRERRHVGGSILPLRLCLRPGFPAMQENRDRRIRAKRDSRRSNGVCECLWMAVYPGVRDARRSSPGRGPPGADLPPGIRALRERARHGSLPAEGNAPQQASEVAEEPHPGPFRPGHEDSSSDQHSAEEDQAGGRYGGILSAQALNRCPTPAAPSSSWKTSK